MHLSAAVMAADDGILNGLGANKSQAQIICAYQHKGIYTYPDTTDENFACQP